MIAPTYLLHYCPDLSRFIRLNLPEYNLETFTEICYKLLSRKYVKDGGRIEKFESRMMALN
jgi:hypothetical protein